MSITDFTHSVRRTRLDNGLTLLTRHEPRGGVVAIMTWVKAGYFHEPDDVAGMAHLFEHMFFKGSKKFPGAEEIATHVSMLGGMTNAGTIYDSTSYYFVLPREGFVRGVEIQADAIRNPLFDPEELRKECEVVIEESNRKFDNPPAVATERMYATAFTEHRMKRWRIGSNDVLRNIRRDHLVAFFETLYRPENIVVSVVGDISHEEAIAVVTREFGPLSKAKLDKHRGPSEPAQTTFRFAESRGDITQSFTVFGWHTPGEDAPDEEHLDLLGTILAGGKYSRLYRDVVGPDKASSVSAGNSTFEDVGVFTIRASCDDANLERVDDAILAELRNVAEHGVTAYELQLAKNKTETAFVFELDEVLGQAQTLAYFEARGGFEEIEAHLGRINATTRDDIRAAAAKYLRTENLTLYHYRPEGVALSDAATVERRVRSVATSRNAPADHPLPPFIAAPPEARVARPLQRYVLSNGITLFVREMPGTPTVAASVLFRGGRIDESSRTAGITQLMARSMRRATKTREHDQINREIEFLGTQLGINVDEDYFGISVDVQQKHLPIAFDLVADVLLHPTFPEKEIDEERHLQISSIRRSLDSSSDRPFQLLNEVLFGMHPYALPSAGYIETVEQFRREQIAQWYANHVVADAGLITIVGDVAADAVRDLCEARFGGMAKSSMLRPAAPLVNGPVSRREVIEYRDRKQTALAIGFPSVAAEHDDTMLLRLLGSVTSGLAGTFFAELRGRRSLAYTVFAGASPRKEAGAFLAYIASDAAKEQAALQGLIEEIRRLSTDGFTSEDVERARSYVAGTTKIRLQTNSAIASELSENYLLGLGLDYTERYLERVRTATVEELKNVASRYLNNDNYAVAIVRGKV